MIVTVGDRDIDPGLVHRLGWDGRDGVELRWADPRDFVRYDIRAQGRQRFLYEHRADVVLLMDADILVAKPFEELIETVFADNVIAGAIAHVSPFERAGQLNSTWAGLFRHCGLRPPRLEYEHPGWGYMSSDERFRYCPAYFNYGVVAAPRDHIRRIADVLDESLTLVQGYAPSFFDAQIALAVAMARTQIPARAMPMRYNFPNDPLLEAMHAAELPYACFLHLLGHHQVSKTGIYTNAQTLRAFADATHLRVTNARAQRIVRDIWPMLELDFARDEAAVSILTD